MFQGICRKIVFQDIFYKFEIVRENTVGRSTYYILRLIFNLLNWSFSRRLNISANYEGVLICISN